MLIEITYNVTDVFMSTTETPVYVEISFEQPGSASAVWGSITGTLSNQTDLQNALNLKVPYTGATTNVNLGEYELKAGQVTLDTSPTGTAAVGTIRWNDTTGTSETTLKGGNVIIKNGVDLVARVVNKVSPNTTLTKAAYQAVRVSGAQGQRLAIELAQANNDAGSADTIGLVTETIAPNQEGFIMTVGQLEGINTTGSLQGETWVDGDVLYLSPTTAGAITNVKPTAVTGHIVVIGYVEYAHLNNGKIYVKVMNGWELDELHNVSIVTPTDNQGLFYNATSTLWENKSITTALGYTPVPTTRNITINGVTYDLSADRTYTISTGISGSGAAGQVTYWTGASAVSGSIDLTYDNANSRLAMGAASFPWRTQYSSIQVGTLRGTTSLWGGKDIVTGGIVQNAYQNTSNQWIYTGTWNAAVYTMTLGEHLWGVSASGTAGTVVTFNYPMRLATSGNLILNNTSSDGGQRLQVYGDTLLRGSGNTSATTALTVQNSDSTNMWRFLNNGDLLVGTTSEVTLRPNNGTITSPQLSGRGLTINIAHISGTGSGVIINNVNGDRTATSGVSNTLLVQNGFAPTSGTGQFNMIVAQGTINQTGGANGITRGLYINPTLTAAADFRAIETSAGNVLFGSNFFWDNANGRLGIGTNAPAYYLEVKLPTGVNTYNNGIALTRGTGVFIIGNGTGNSTNYIPAIYAKANYDAQGFAFTASVFSASSTAPAMEFQAANSTNTGAIGASQTAVRFANWTTQIVDFKGNGNVMIGTSSDLGTRLGVLGDTLLRGSGATSATTALTVQNSSSTNLFTVRNDNRITIRDNYIEPYQSGSLVNDAIKIVGSNNGATIGIQNANAAGFSGIEYLNNSGAVRVFTGFNNNNGTEFRFNNVATNGYTTFLIGSTQAMTIKTNRQIRFHPLSSAPASPEAGDVYYDSTLNKLRVYTTAWETITSI